MHSVWSSNGHWQAAPTPHHRATKETIMANVFNSGNGQLLWDVDGTGPVAAIHFVNLPTNLMLSAANFSVLM
jgi:hypothetical protein